VRKGFLSATELDAVCGQLDPDTADLVRFLFCSSWRVGEARALEWKDYDRESASLRLWTSKSGHGRVIPVAGVLREIVERRLAVRGTGERFVFSRNGQPIRDFRKRWKSACKRAAFPPIASSTTCGAVA